MYNSMKKLIAKRYYKSAGEAQDKIDVFFAVGCLTGGQYTELSKLIEDVYAL